MANHTQSNQPNKHALRDAQARHQSALFGDQVQKPSSQDAEAESRERGQSLSQAAAQKRQQLSPEEAAKLAELQTKSAAAKPTPRPPAAAQPPPAPPSQSAKELHEVARRSDLAAEAVANMQRNLKRTPRTPAPSMPSAQPQPQPQSQPQPAAPLPTPRPTVPAAQPGQPRPAGKRPAPSPEELDTLLREMAQRSASRRSAGGRPGAERGESGPTVEAPPEPPPEVTAEEEKSPEKQAEILRELKAREATAQRDVAPIPQADQERAEERAVEATVPIRTEGNAVSAAPLHAAIADLQNAMRAHDAPGQVAGVNVVQRTMPNHPLYAPAQTDDQPAPGPQSPQEPHGA